MITINALPSSLDCVRTGLVYPKPGTDCCAVKPSAPVDIFAWGKVRHADPAEHYYIGAVFNDADAFFGTDCVELYPNDEFETFYEVDDENTDDDMRAIALRTWFLFTTGEQVIVVHATKTKPVILLGVITEHDTVETREGPVECIPGDYLVESPDNHGQIWTISKTYFEKKYVLA
jgi:hypothetical protein